MVIVVDAAGVIFGVLLVCAIAYDLVQSTRRDWKRLRENEKIWRRWRDQVSEACDRQDFAEANRLVSMSDAQIREGKF